MFPPLFETDRLRLAAPLPDDREALARWSTDADYMRHLDDDPVRPMRPADYDYTTGDGSHDSHYFHLRTVPDDVLIGFVVLSNIKWASGTAELAIGIGDAAHRGKGYGQEAMRLILGFAFRELNLYRVGLRVMSYNVRAIHVYEKIGFTQEGALRGMVLREGVRHDLLLYGILRDEWLAANT